MKRLIINIIIWVLIPLSVTILLCTTIIKCIDKDSSPVEKMYDYDTISVSNTYNHYDYDYIVDNDEITVRHDSLGRVIMPNE